MRRRGWGGVARKGGANLRSQGREMSGTRPRNSAPEPIDQWIREDERPVATAPRSERAVASYALPGDVQTEVRRVFVGTAYQREKAVTSLTRAAEAYDRHRYEEALRLARQVAERVPGVAAVQELVGLAAYRAQQWPVARSALRAHFMITGDAEHLPAVMDCERAGHRYRAVAKTFDELVASTPTADVLAEGRIVMAGTLADQGHHTEAIDLLVKSGAARLLRNPAYRHVRLWYALGDLYDRAGDTASAREMFARVLVADPEAYDVRDRIEELGGLRERKNRPVRRRPVSTKRRDD